MPCVNLSLELDDGSVLSERFLLFVAANGLFYGGGFKAASEASLNDGLIDIVAVKKISLLRFLTLVSKYKKGKIINTETFKKVGLFTRVRSVNITNDSEFLLCSDGELMKTTFAGIKIIHNAIKFVVPRGCNGICNEKSSDSSKIDERAKSRT